MSTYEEAGQEMSFEMNERLRSELGWTEVSKGLSKVLIGYAVMLLGILVGLGLLLMSVYGMGEELKRSKMPSNTSMWQFYIGLAILGLVGIFGYGMIIAGQFRCMMGASERHGARWFMFFCITCLFFGPALNIAAGIACAQKPPEFQQGAQGLAEIQPTQTGQYVQMAGFAAWVLYSLLFVLFLRAVAKCLDSHMHVALVNFYLIFAGFLVAGTAFVQFGPKNLAVTRDLMVTLGIGWGICFLFYIFVIASVRGCITTTMARVRSPLEM
jgi:hypothetical protein